MYQIQLLIAVCTLKFIGGTEVTITYVKGPLLGKTCIGMMTCDYDNTEFYLRDIGDILLDGAPKFTYELVNGRNSHLNTNGPFNLCDNLNGTAKIVQQFIKETYFEGKNCNEISHQPEFKIKLKSTLEYDSSYKFPDSTIVIELFRPEKSCSTQFNLRTYY